MAKEIERKFLVSDTSFITAATCMLHILQGYLCTDPDCTVRVRVIDKDAFLTIKTRNHGAVRNEWEYPIPMTEALEMLEKCGDKKLEKTRYKVPFDGHVWEVDVFSGKLQGLTMAEVELENKYEPFSLPPFVAKEVTNDVRYYNSSLVAASGLPSQE